MRHSSGPLRASLITLAAIVVSASLLADSNARSRVTIRGRGTNVVIEGDRASFPSRLNAGGRLLAEAVRLKRKGEDDAAVIAYLRGHQGDIPSVIGAADVARLRRAGAGKGLVSYLLSVAAMDIGPTGEGSPLASNEPVYPMEAESPPYALPYGYPIYSSAPFGRQHHFRSHAGFPLRPIPHRPMMPRPPARLPSIGGIPRFPLQ